MASAFQCDAFQQNAFQNDCAASVAETPTGGWFRTPKAHFREETDTERRARIKAERIRMGILPPDPAPDMQPDAPGLSTTLSTARGETGAESARSSTYSLAAYLLPEDLAGLEALAARAAELTIDEEIAHYFRLQDEDDAAVLLLAMATIH